MNSMQQGKFITFEGGEGSGKTTQSKLLYKKLLANGINAVWTHEIGGTEVADLIRNIVLFKEMSLTTELLLIIAARSDHIEKIIRPHLQDNKWVICDRFIDSTLCYQGQNDQDFKLVLQLHKMLFNNILPDLTLNICVSPNIAMERINLRKSSNPNNKINKFDQKDLLFHQKIVDFFSYLCSIMPDRMVQVDGNTAIDDVYLQVINTVQQRMNVKLLAK